MNSAYFVKYPRRMEDLQRLHVSTDERPYNVIKIVTLSAIDYENFITDMGADRQFLEDTAMLFKRLETRGCILVRQRGRRDGVLVIPDLPERPQYVQWAAYLAKA